MADAEIAGGLTLAQYAAVKAAKAEPFPIGEVLAIERIEAAVWAKADLAWTVRLCQEPALLQRYQAELGVAEDRLVRKVSPLEDDVAAWLAFLASFAAAPDAAGWLGDHGLGMNDLARLRRRWELRARVDPDFDKTVARLKKRGPGALPPLSIEPARLVRSGAAPAPVTPAPEVAARPPITAPDVPFEKWAQVCGELDAGEDRPAAVLARHGIAREDLPAIEAAYQARFAADPQAARDFVLLRAHHRARSSRRAPATKKVFVEAGTAVLEEAAIVDLPFRATPSAAFLDAMATAPKAAPGAGSDGGTLVAASPFAPPPVADPPAAPVPAPVVQIEAATTVALSPFAAPAETPMALERHASICVELSAPGANEAEVLARYRITTEEKVRADRFYKARLAIDPALRAAWNEAFAVYRAWFMRG